MVDKGEIRQQVLQSTLEEVTLREGNGDSSVFDPCVICLEQISEKSIAKPCNHGTFDFLCLVSWLQERPTCPLCKTEVISVSFDIESSGGAKVYLLDSKFKKEDERRSTAPYRSRPHSQHGSHYSRPRRPQPGSPPPPSDALVRRRHIYRENLYSLHVGSNRLSKFRELTPREFSSDEELISRARKWIRRELQVFDFLNVNLHTSSTSDERPQRRASNAEFLLEYIVAILRTVDIKGSGGQAEDLLQEFLGRQNTRLFLHELQAWLRSPYFSLEDWDRAVQYDECNSKRQEPPVSLRVGNSPDNGRRNSNPTCREGRGGVRKPSQMDSHRRPYPNDHRQFSRRLEAAQRRYEPD